MIQLKFFAAFRERAGISSMRFEQETHTDKATVSDLMDALLEEYPKLAFLKENNVLVAVNQTICDVNAKLNDGDEVAFFPPVTGG